MIEFDVLKHSPSIDQYSAHSIKQNDESSYRCNSHQATITLSLSEPKQIQKIKFINDGSAMVEILGRLKKNEHDDEEYKVLLPVTPLIKYHDWKNGGLFQDEYTWTVHDKLNKLNSKEYYNQILISLRGFNDEAEYVGVKFISLHSDSEFEAKPKAIPKVQLEFISDDSYDQSQENIFLESMKHKIEIEEEPKPVEELKEEEEEELSLTQKPLLNVIISVSGIGKERSELKTMAVEIGADYSHEWPSSSDKEKVLIVDKNGSWRGTPKYKAAISQNAPIVDKQWILDSYKSLKKQPYAKYLVENNNTEKRLFTIEEENQKFEEWKRFVEKYTLKMDLC